MPNRINVTWEHNHQVIYARKFITLTCETSSIRFSKVNSRTGIPILFIFYVFFRLGVFLRLFFVAIFLSVIYLFLFFGFYFCFVFIYLLFVFYQESHQYISLFYSRHGVLVEAISFDTESSNPQGQGILYLLN